MADSDNTRVCPSVTRRKLLAGTTAATAAWPFQQGATTEALAGNAAFDPALSHWHAWKAACLDTTEACRTQQQLETRLLHTIGFPCAQVYLPVEDVSIGVTWDGEIEELFGDDSALAASRAKAEADLAEHQARWDAEDKRIGYSAAKRKELVAADRERELLDTLTATPATSLAGVAGKLDAVLQEGESREGCTELPWPQIRSAIADLVRIGQVLEPGVFMPGSDREWPYPRQRRETANPSVMICRRDRMA